LEPSVADVSMVSGTSVPLVVRAVVATLTLLLEEDVTKSVASANVYLESLDRTVIVVLKTGSW